MLKIVLAKFFLFFLLGQLFVACNVTLKKDGSTTQIKKLFFESDQTLNDIMVEGNNKLNELVLSLPPEFENDYDRANDVCIPDGTLDVFIISMDESVQQKLLPFFRFYCELGSKNHEGTAKNIALTKSFSCLASMGKLFIYDLNGGEKKTEINFSEAKKCFSLSASKNWFEKNIEIDPNGILSMEIKEMDKKEKDKFGHQINFTTNNFEASLRLRVNKNMSGTLLEYFGQDSKVVFGMSSTFLDDQFILRYDWMASNDVTKQVDRSRLFLNLKKKDQGIILNDLDFWRLSSNQTSFVIDMVNGGDRFGYLTQRKILIVGENGESYEEFPLICASGDACIKKDIKLPGKDKLYLLGNWNSTKEAMQQVLEDNELYKHNNAHFGLTPNLRKTSWELLDGPIAETKRSFMNKIIDKEYIYFVGGKKFVDGELVDVDDALKLNLKNLVPEKVSNESVPDLIIPQVGERRYSGVYKDENISFEFGGFENGKLVNSGWLYKGAKEISLQTLFSNNGFDFADLNIYPVFSPIVSFTGQHLIVYGGLGFTVDQKINSVKMGFVIDVLEEKAWMMNMANAPNWITQAVWAEDRLIAWGGYEINYKYLYPEIIAHNNGASYHLGTNSWSNIPNGPLAPRLGHQLVWANDRLVVFSGSDSFGDANITKPQPVNGAAIFIPGEVTKIFFTEVYQKPMSIQKVETENDWGEFYLDGEFNLDSIIEVYHGDNCRESNLGMMPSVTMKYLGHGKMKIKFNLIKGDNWVSVTVKNGAEKVCTNALNFKKL